MALDSSITIGVTESHSERWEEIMEDAEGDAEADLAEMVMGVIDDTYVSLHSAED